VVENFSDDNYMVQAPMDFFGNKPCEVHVRYLLASVVYHADGILSEPRQ